MQATRSAIFLSVLFLALSAQAQAQAQAADWPASFPPPAVASHLETGGRAVLVAAAGEEGEARDAALALTAALRASGKTRLVMDSASLGKVAGLGDAEIVQRCAALPVELVAVVRVFPGAADAPPSVVVTIYDLKGAAVAAFSTDQGKPLAAKESSGAGGGVSSAAVQAVQRVEAATPSGDDARRTYEERFLWFHERVWIDSQTGGIVNQNRFAYQGKNGRQLGSAEFYELAGRPDLAARYRKTATRRSWFAWGGGAAMLAGLALAPLSLTPLTCPRHDGYGQCVGHSSTYLLVGLGVVGAGLTSMFVAGAIDPEPVPPHEARGIAEEHNRKLRAKLGLTVQRDSELRGERPIALQVAAFPLSEGGGVALGARW